MTWRVIWKRGALQSEDYVFFDYDGAGRPTTEITGAPRGKADGSGVEAPDGLRPIRTELLPI